MDAVEYAEHSRAVGAAFVASYGDYVVRRLGAFGVSAVDAKPAVVQGLRSLSGAFGRWSELPATDQQASPLELFREALIFPTELLTARRAAEVSRDEAAEAALPGDVYDLAPATSRDLSEEAWQAHVTWGLARAAAVAGVVPRPPAESPVVSGAVAALVSTNLMDRTRIESVAAGSGYQLVVWRNPGAIADGLATASPSLAIVDLEHAAAQEAIRAFDGAGVRIVAFGPHVDDLAMAAAGALGAGDVLARSAFFRRLPSLFPKAT